MCTKLIWQKTKIWIQIEQKEKAEMIKITKEEAEYIRENSNIYISVTGRGKRSRHKNRYATETRKTHKLLNDFHRKCKRQVFN